MKRQGCLGGPPVGSLPRSSMGDLFDVVDDGEELPLGVHLASAAEGEAPHALVLQIGEDGFDGWHSASVDGAPCRAIKLPAHAFGGCVLASA